jgi:ubiquinone/menaquinone biosynthesis C-methylase UbiE
MKIIDTLKGKLTVLLTTLRFCISRFFALIYDYAVTYPVTVRIYKYLLKNRFYKDFPACKPGAKGDGVSIIDIGTASGTCLKNIVDKAQFDKVLAIDINKEYIASATKLFEGHKNVEVKL